VMSELPCLEVWVSCAKGALGITHLAVRFFSIFSVNEDYVLVAKVIQTQGMRLTCLDAKPSDCYCSYWAHIALLLCPLPGTSCLLSLPHPFSLPEGLS
jgi:hypothetical protein